MRKLDEIFGKTTDLGEYILMMFCVRVYILHVQS